MKSRISMTIITLLIFATCGSLFSQHYVPMEPSDKNVIYEEFTGVKCSNCPDGHAVMAQILADNPGRAFVVAYHPFNSNYTLPYTGDPDFRRHYADSLYMSPWCGTSRFVPSAFVARRLWTPGERITSRTSWQSYGTTIMSEPSPLNVGMATHYNEATHLLTVVVDVYFTESVAGTFNLMVTLAENDLVSQQLGATGLYTHKHTFREALVGQWGDLLVENPQAGTFHTRQFTFDNSTAGYIMENCELLAFVIDNGTTEAVSGIGCAAGDTTFVTPDVTLSTDTLWFTTGQQCLEGLPAWIRNNTAEPVDLTDVQSASLVPGPLMWVVDPWPFTTFPHTVLPGDSVKINVKVMLPVYQTLTGFVIDSLSITSEVDTRYLMIAVDEDLLASLEGTMVTPSVSRFVCSPNPVKDHTTFSFLLPADGDATVEVRDLGGRVVAIPFTGYLERGVHQVSWNGRDMEGNLLPAGVYFGRISAGGMQQSMKLVRMD
jgi:hypothetical protein